MSAQLQPQQPVLLREDRDGIATLTLNRPAQMNLLTSRDAGGAAGRVRFDRRRTRTSASWCSPPPARASAPATT